MSYVGDKIREALKTMNDEGAHWTQGAMCQPRNPLIGAAVAFRTDPKSCRFCAVGGLRVAFFGSPHRATDASDEGRGYGKALRIIGDVAGEDAPFGPTLDNLENRVIAWNDRDGADEDNEFDDELPKTTWEDVVRVFTEAAKKADRLSDRVG